MLDLKALLFDVNGTLIDIETDEDREEIYRAISNFLSYQGITLPWREARALYYKEMKAQRQASPQTHSEFDVVEVWSEILKRFPGSAQISHRFEKYHQLSLILAELQRGISRVRFQLYPQVKEILDQLSGRYRLGVVSDAQSAFATTELQALGLGNYFTPIVVSGDFGYRKPDRRLFEKALEVMEVRPDQTIFIGNDMYRDIFGAKQLGMKTVFFQTQYGTKQHPGVEADYIIYHFAQLLEAINFLKEGLPTETTHR